MTIVLLTLETHRSGIWNTLLIDRLNHLLNQNNNDSINNENNHVQIVTLESTLTSLSNPFPPNTTLVVNRVSDATNLYKETVALLTCCERLWKIPVWNGAIAYGMVANKWCHSTLLNQAGLASPPSQRVHTLSSSVDSQSLVSEDYDGKAIRFSPILYKPNAGGFGAGIVKANDFEELQALSSERDITTNDGMAVLQQYMQPHENRLYRVWFLRGKVQCALIRQNSDGIDEFTTGCAAKGACSMEDRTKKQPTLIAYSIPNDVRNELENELLSLLPDAHCGSIEYLCDAHGERFYFDINLLSTLPLLEAVENKNAIWSANYDPWCELAKAIIDFAAEIG